MKTENNLNEALATAAREWLRGCTATQLSHTYDPCACDVCNRVYLEQVAKLVSEHDAAQPAGVLEKLGDYADSPFGAAAFKAWTERILADFEKLQSPPSRKRQPFTMPGYPEGASIINSPDSIEKQQRLMDCANEIFGSGRVASLTVSFYPDLQELAKYWEALC